MHRGLLPYTTLTGIHLLHKQTHNISLQLPVTTPGSVIVQPNRLPRQIPQIGPLGELPQILDPSVNLLDNLLQDAGPVPQPAIKVKFQLLVKPGTLLVDGVLVVEPELTNGVLVAADLAPIWR